MCFVSYVQVAVARMQNTQQVYALKIMNKWDMLRRGEVNSQSQIHNSIHYDIHCMKHVAGLCIRCDEKEETSS